MFKLKCTYVYVYNYKAMGCEEAISGERFALTNC